MAKKKKKKVAIKESVNDTVARAKAMLAQTKAEGSKSFKGSSYDKGSSKTPAKVTTVTPKTTPTAPTGGSTGVGLTPEQVESLRNTPGIDQAALGNYVSSGAVRAGANTSGYANLKDMSIKTTPPQTPQQSPEDYAKAIMDAMSQNNPDTSGVGTQSTQGDASAGVQPGVNDAVAGAVGQQAPGGGTQVMSAAGPGVTDPAVMSGAVPMATIATGGYQKIGPAYFQKTSDGMRAVSDPSIISGLKHGTIPYTTGQLDGTTFSKYSVPLTNPGTATAKNAVKESLGLPSSTEGVDEGADIGTTYQAQKDKYGLGQTQTDLWSDPQKTVTDMTKAVYKMSGMEDANRAIENITSDLEDLENERDDKIADINDNPWLTEGVRLRQIASVEERYEDRIANHTNKLRLLEDVRNNAQQQAQFAIGTAISLWDKERTFQQGQIDRWNEQAQRAIDNDFKSKAYNMEMETSYINSYLDAKENGFEGGFYEYTHPEKSGDTADWQMFNAGDGSTMMYNQRTGAMIPVSGGPTDKAQSEAMNTVNDIENLIADPAFSSAYGLSNIAKRNIPGNPAYVVAQNHENLMSVLALAARGKLKGQGAVSDFEGRLLRRAQTSLTLNMNPQQATFELQQVAGAIRTSSGLTAIVRITAPNGQSKVGEADQQMINEAVASGYRVQYE